MYEIKREVYDKLKRFVLESNKPICALLGRYGVGKTTVLKELMNELQKDNYKVVYYNSLFKTSDEEFYMKLDEMVNNEIYDIIILDDIHWIECFELVFWSMCDYYDEGRKTKLIFSSQLVEMMVSDLENRCDMNYEVIFMTDITYREFVNHLGSISNDNNAYEYLSEYDNSLDAYVKFAGCFSRSIDDFIDNLCMQLHAVGRTRQTASMYIIEPYRHELLFDLIYIIATQDFSTSNFTRLCSFSFIEFRKALFLLKTNNLIIFESKTIDRFNDSDVFFFLSGITPVRKVSLKSIKSAKEFFDRVKVLFRSASVYQGVYKNLEWKSNIKLTINFVDIIKVAIVPINSCVYSEKYDFDEENRLINVNGTNFRYEDFLINNINN